MPPPALLLVAAGGGAAKVATSHAVRSFSSLTLASLLVREVWKCIPEWIQKDVGFRSSFKDDEDKDELNSLSLILSKLQDLLQVGREKLNLSVTNWHIAFLLTVQLMAQIQVQCPNVRNEFYMSKLSSNDEKHVNVNDTSLQKLRLMLDYAIWAYEDNTQILSDWLQPYGFTILQQSDPDTEKRGPGYVVYFLAINQDSKELLVGVRGTYSLEDVVTDCCGNAVPFHAQSPNTHLHETESDDNHSSKHYPKPTTNTDTGDSDEIKQNIELCIIQSEEEKKRYELDFSTNDTASSARVDTIVYVSDKIGNDTSSPSLDENNESISLRLKHCDNDFVINEQVEICMVDNAGTGKDTNKEVIICNYHNDSGDTAFYCHEGVFIAAKRLVKSIRSLVTHFVNTCGYKIIFSGHSLGAGVASLAALILSTNGDIHKDNMHVYAFASPPVVDYQTSIHSQSFITTIVNNSDIIPRSSMANLIIFTSFLKKVHEIHSQTGNNSNDTAQKKKSLFRKLWEGTGGDLLMSQEEISNSLWNSHCTLPLQDPDHLYVPGRVLFLYEPWEEESTKDGKDENKENQTIHKINMDASHQALQVIELDISHSFTDHLTTSYCRNLDFLIAEEQRYQGIDNETAP